MRGLPHIESPIARRLLRFLQLWLGKVSTDASRPVVWWMLWLGRRVKNLLRAACSKRIALNALRISLVVGTILNLINQSGVIFAGADVSWLHVFLNYLVPYSVATYSAAKNQTDHKESIS